MVCPGSNGDFPVIHSEIGMYGLVVGLVGLTLLGTDAEDVTELMELVIFTTIGLFADGASLFRVLTCAD